MLLRSLTAVAVTTAVASSASAMLIESFESAPVGSIVLGGQGVVVDAGNGITDGSQAARRVNTPGSYANIAQVDLVPFMTAGATSATFTVDWTIENLTGSGGYLNLTAALGGAGFDQLSSPGENGLIVLDGGSGPVTTTVTYVLDAAELASLNAFLTAGSAKLELYANKDPGFIADFTVDNITLQTDTLIPEPASMALLSIAGLALMSRRRG